MNTSWFGPLVGQLLVQLPVMVACVVGMIVLLAKREQAGAGFIWGLLGFLLLLICTLASPITWRIIWMLSEHNNAVFTLSSVFWNVLRGGAYGLLLVAILAGHSDRHP